MANTYKDKGLTGKSGRKVIETIALPRLAVVLDETTAVKVAGHPINDATKSGKQEGALVVSKSSAGILSLAIASGSAPKAAWKYDITEADLSVITPA
ncbi:hypothetical protein POP72_048 [Pectobacterium phage POP72]|uniref:Uncharacterized protein n=2 Tax=Axomammavirus PP1 TaxID=2733578 RepID=I7F4Z9_9CAUD|nr:acetyl-CoA acetyltransferase [Pectobacterium phage PP1]AFP33706.1 hypothetical protein PP1_043 [Pectobacterium phage PP1]ARB10964.1 hypothetical protein POP72_048 [Pectobacterium phage POP72]